MSRFLVVTWDGAGNLVSTLGIAQRLVRQGDDVRVLGHRSIQRRCGDHGWRFVPFEQAADFDSAVQREFDDEMGWFAQNIWFSAAVGRDVVQELASEPADVLVVDAMLFTALAAAEASGTPTAALFHAPFALFRGGPLVEMMAPGLSGLNAFRSELGLAPVERVSDLHDACASSLVAVPREFEPEMPLPPNVRFVGPVLDGPPLTTAGEDIDAADGPEPLVVVSFSTSYQGQDALLQRLVDALATLPVRAIVTTGPSLDPGTFNAGANTRVVQYAPHDGLFPHASAVITHAGLGTVMTALREGVPLVCLPLGRDQFFNAAMIERLGAGRVLGGDADLDAIRGAVLAVLDDETSKEGAKRMANVIAGYGGGADAVAELEELI